MEQPVDLFISREEKEQYVSALQILQKRLQKNIKDKYLAKGELHGSSYPLWRSKSSLLEGVGFNYDYADEEGTSKELKTGSSFSSIDLMNEETLIQKGDLLITSGYDGVFPEGLHVAVVEEVSPLEKGQYCYSLKAMPTAHNLNDLQIVFILPPLSGEDQSF
jgi:hypothetical protein